jgi:FMN phosphatase YigB (HAD superfamily)
MTVTAMVLDFGNVVGFFDHGKATNRLAPLARMPREGLHRLLHESELATAFECGRVSPDAFREQVCREAELECHESVFDAAYGDIFWPNSVMNDLVPLLARKYPLYLLSNTNALHARQFLKQFASTLGHFRSLFLSHLVGARKPDAEIFAHAMQEIGRPPGELIFVDDIEANVAAARSHGWQGIVYNGGDLREKLADLDVRV